MLKDRHKIVNYRGRLIDSRNITAVLTRKLTRVPLKLPQLNTYFVKQWKPEKAVKPEIGSLKTRSHNSNREL